MTEPNIIKEHYQKLVANLFDMYYGTFLTDPTPAQMKEAEANFRNGIILARQARDKAITLLP